MGTLPNLKPLASPLCLIKEQAEHADLIATFLAQYFPQSYTRSSEQLRKGQCPVADLSFLIFEHGTLIALIRSWAIYAGEKQGQKLPAVLLGPLVVADSFQGSGLGSYLIRYVLHMAKQQNIGACFLVGDPEYYSRFGFSAQLAQDFFIANEEGRYEKRRFQAIELIDDWLQNASGALIPA